MLDPDRARHATRAAPRIWVQQLRAEACPRAAESTARGIFRSFLPSTMQPEGRRRTRGGLPARVDLLGQAAATALPCLSVLFQSHGQPPGVSGEAHGAGVGTSARVGKQVARGGSSSESSRRLALKLSEAVSRSFRSLGLFCYVQVVNCLDLFSNQIKETSALVTSLLPVSR